MNREIEEELASHLAEGIAEGRDPAEVRRAFGPALQIREESRDFRLVGWLDSLRADAIFGWRQILKRKVTSSAAILSLALAIGACTSAFRLIDALLLRPLPVAGAERLYSITYESPSPMDGAPVPYDSCSYPMFLRMRAAVRDQAESIAISMYNGPTDLTYGSDQDMERVNFQYVSGWMFGVFGLRPAAGRLITSDDDSAPGAHPYAVLSYDYWAHRFGLNPNIVGRTFRMGNDVYEIVGVAQRGFTGTETGFATDVFVPMAMKNPRTLASLNSFWMRTLLQLKPGVDPAPLQEQLRATFRAIQEERVAGFPGQSRRDRERMFQEKLFLEPASSGRSNLQRNYRQALEILGLLVALVLMIACANVANLMTARAASRAREMALRVSIGAGRSRLVQLVLIESAWLAILATAIGGIFAWWSAPFVLRTINLGPNIARLDLPMDWRVVGFAFGLACAVTFLFGLTPALRASAVKPASALRGGEDPHWRGRIMRGLIAVQVAFCFVVLLAAGLFVTTFQRLSDQPMGFSAERILNVESVTKSPQSPALWEQVAERLRAVPGIEKVALSGWPLLSGENATGNISVNGAPPAEVFSDFVAVSPGWADVMRIPILDGRDFRPGDVNPAVAMVNQAFARQYFNGENPMGKWFERVDPVAGRSRFQIVGFIRDARSRDQLRLAIRPTVYIPFASVDDSGALKPVGRGTFVVRTARPNPMTLGAILRKEVANARPGFRVQDLHTQVEFDQTDTVKERLLAMLAAFFGAVALLLAGVGMYGVLDYFVIQRRREIGIRIAIGAGSADIVRRVSFEGFAMVLLGAIAGLAIGIAAVRCIQSILFQVRLTDSAILALPALTIFTAALLASLPAVIRAARTDPVKMLRAE
ncbi:MAG TPA: ABC transporter permease [Bryobacteraceae bacterium]|nr:ABC transporter permease [Bryobacteraceae bacterium]